MLIRAAIRIQCGEAGLVSDDNACRLIAQDSAKLDAESCFVSRNLVSAEYRMTCIFVGAIFQGSKDVIATCMCENHTEADLGFSNNTDMQALSSS